VLESQQVIATSTSGSYMPNDSVFNVNPGNQGSPITFFYYFNAMWYPEDSNEYRPCKKSWIQKIIFIAMLVVKI
jgi:hypothetical protein